MWILGIKGFKQSFMALLSPSWTAESYRHEKIECFGHFVLVGFQCAYNFRDNNMNNYRAGPVTSRISFQSSI